MAEVKIDCFAYQETGIKCRALKELNCKNCKFYKKRATDKSNNSSKDNNK